LLLAEGINVTNTTTPAAVEALKLADELRDACMKIRVKASIPLSALIPIMQRAADALAHQPPAAVQAKREPLSDQECRRLYTSIADDPCAEPSVRALAMAVIRATERAQGIGPATQEKQHG
jgi:hypothetical protein